MFTGFNPARRDQVFERRRGASFLIAVGIYLAAGGYGVYLHYEKGKQVDVLLEPEIKDFAMEEAPEPEPEEEAPPPPPEAPPPQPKVEKPRPKPKPRLDVIPEGPPPEAAAPRDDKAYGTGSGGTGTGAAKAPEKKPEKKPEPAPKPKEAAKPKPKPKEVIDPTVPIDRPERSTPPKPDPGNTPPEYPKELRDNGVEGEVVIKLHVANDGSVKGMKVLRKTNTATGEEAQGSANKLFLKAVVAAVKGWKYTPCMVQGQAISVWIPVTIPFKLKGG